MLTGALIFSLLTSIGLAEEVCPAGSYRVKGHPRTAYIRSDGTFVNATRVKSYCKEKSKAFEYLMTRFKDRGPSTWPNKDEKSRNWKISEKERVIEALEDLPNELFSQNLKGFYRMAKSKDFQNPASNADAHIVLYDSAFDSKRNLARVISHELAHLQFQGLSDAERQDYRRQLGWTVKVEKRHYFWERTGEVVEEDGRISVEEDFANNIDHYLFDFDKLKKITPRAVSWIEKRFGKGFKLKRK